MRNKTLEVYNILMNYIFKRKILPGERIYIDNLSKKLNISPTPLREALNCLCQEDLITHVANHGYTLRVITSDEMREIYELCEVLQVYAIERAVNSIKAPDLLELENNLIRHKRIIQSNFSQEWYLINNEFHIKIGKLGGNQLIANYLQKAYEKLWLWWRIKNSDRGRMSEIYDEHLIIYNALKSRDVEMAINAMRNHILKNKENFLREVQGEEEEDYFGSFIQLSQEQK